MVRSTRQAYNYAGGNPIDNVDPDGRKLCGDFCGGGNPIGATAEVDSDALWEPLADGDIEALAEQIEGEGEVTKVFKNGGKQIDVGGGRVWAEANWDQATENIPRANIEVANEKGVRVAQTGRYTVVLRPPSASSNGRWSLDLRSHGDLIFKARY